MHIVVLFFILFIVGCGANMNSFNINVEGTVDYQNNPNNSNTNSNTGNNTNSGTNNNTNTGTNNSGTNNNTNTGTNNNTNSNTNNSTNNNTNANITNNLGTQLGTTSAIEVAAIGQTPSTGGVTLDVQVYQDYLIVTYPVALTKIKYYENDTSAGTDGLVNGTTGRIPRNSSYFKVYITEDGDPVTKVFDVTTPSSGTMPTS